MPKKKTRRPTPSAASKQPTGKPGDMVPFIPRGRFILAIDSEGLHIRRTVCVHHDRVHGVIQYDAKPLFSIRGKKAVYAIKAALRLLIGPPKK